MRQNNFNFLRFLFSFIVVIGHLIVISGNKLLHQFSPYFDTYISVTSFFCISGFLITQSYLNTKQLKDYFIKRAARLLPAYISVIMLSIILLSFISSYSFIEYYSHPQLFKYIAANLSFLNFIQPCLPGVFQAGNLTCTVNGALWTLKIEVCFYLLLPVLLFYAEKTNKKIALFALIYILSVTYKISLEYISDYTHNQTYTILARQLPAYLSYFVSGIVGYYFYERFIKYKTHIFIGATIIFLIERRFGLELFTPLALSAIVFTIAFSLKRLNAFGKSGDISYGIYIFHCPIIQTITYFGFFNKYNPLIVGLLTIIIILLTGFASWHYIEKGFLKRSHSIRVRQEPTASIF